MMSLISKMSSIRMLSVHRQKLRCMLRVHATVMNSSLASAEGNIMHAAERKRGGLQPGLWSWRWFPTSCRQSVQPLGRTPLQYWETNSSLAFCADKITMCGLRAWQKQNSFNSWSLALAQWNLQEHLNHIVQNVNRKVLYINTLLLERLESVKIFILQGCIKLM